MAPYRPGTYGERQSKPSHTKRHVDRMLFEEATRIMTGNVGDLESASSFVSPDAASAIIDDTLMAYDDRIRRWRDTEATQILQIDRLLGQDDIIRLGVPVAGLGMTIDKATRRVWIARSSHVRLILRRDPALLDGYTVHTVFPLVADEHGERMDVDPLPYFLASPAWPSASPSRRAFISLSCDHGDKLDGPLWFDEATDSVTIPVAEGDEQLGTVHINEGRSARWCLSGCDPQRMHASFERVVMARAFPETWAKARTVKNEVTGHRVHKDLENDGQVDIQPFVPDLRLRAIVNSANIIIRNAEIERQRLEKLEQARQAQAAEAADAPDGGAVTVGDSTQGVVATPSQELPSRGDAGEAREPRQASLHGKRIAKGAAERARREAEKARRKREKAEERARKKAEQEERERTLREANEATDGPDTVATVDGDDTAGGEEKPKRRMRDMPREWYQRRAKGFEEELRPPEFWRVPRYNSDTNDILVVLAGLDAFVTGDSKDGHPELGGIVLHADEGDILASFARIRELNADAMDAMDAERARILAERGDGNGTFVNELTGYPDADEDTDELPVDPRDMASDDERDDIYYPEWWETAPIRHITVETPFPSNLAHLVDEGRYDLLTVDETNELLEDNIGWDPLASIDLLMGFGIRIVPGGDDEEDDADEATPDEEPTRVTGTDTRRIAQLPSFCTKAVPSTTYMSAEEKLVASIAEEASKAIREGNGGDASPTPATNSVSVASLMRGLDATGDRGSQTASASDADGEASPKDRLRRMLGGNDAIGTGRPVGGGWRRNPLDAGAAIDDIYGKARADDDGDMEGEALPRRKRRGRKTSSPPRRR